MSDKLDKGDKVLNRRIVLTADGSTSFEIPEMNEIYHSKKGAILESQFVYIDHGLALIDKPRIDVLEIGMGTGLNVLLSYLYANNNAISINFCTLEPFPLIENEWQQLNYEAQLNLPDGLIRRLHTISPNEATPLSEKMQVVVHHTKLENWNNSEAFDLVLFDAFAPNKQSSPWEFSNIQKVYNLLRPNGVLTTYCAQGQFKRNLQTVGFDVTNPAGPMGKREITVALKK